MYQIGRDPVVQQGKLQLSEAGYISPKPRRGPARYPWIVILLVLAIWFFHGRVPGSRAGDVIQPPRLKIRYQDEGGTILGVLSEDGRLSLRNERSMEYDGLDEVRDFGFVGDAMWMLKNGVLSLRRPTQSADFTAVKYVYPLDDSILLVRQGGSLKETVGLSDVNGNVVLLPDVSGCILYASGDSGRFVACTLDLDEKVAVYELSLHVDGKRRWQVPLWDIPLDVKVSATGVVLLTRKGITALDFAGNIAWRRQCAGARGVAVGGQRVYYGRPELFDSTQVICVDNLGREMWRRTVWGTVTDLSWAEEFLVVTSTRGVRVYSASGDLMWYERDAVSADLRNGRLAWADGQGVVRIVNAQEGHFD
ncbi:MAG: hypothetical protein AB1497_05965 [Bacillota bacterium]